MPLGWIASQRAKTELWRSAVFGPHPQLKWIFQHLWFAIGTKILIG
jgi:hypothetical protein